jgi:hypothetical protein
MSPVALFSHLGSQDMATIIDAAKRSVCYAGPGIQAKPAQAMAEAAARLGAEMLTVCLDFDERAMRMGYGDIGAVKLLRDAGISVRSTPGLRTALVIADDVGFIFTPTALYLEPESTSGAALNASSSHFKPTAGGCWRRLAHEDWQTWAMKIEGNSGCSENNAGKQYVMVLTSNLIEVVMIFRCPAHFNRCPHPPAEPRCYLDREGSGCIPGFARRAQAEQRPAL